MDPTDPIFGRLQIKLNDHHYLIMIIAWTTLNVYYYEGLFLYFYATITGNDIIINIIIFFLPTNPTLAHQMSIEQHNMTWPYAWKLFSQVMHEHYSSTTNTIKFTVWYWKINVPQNYITSTGPQSCKIKL